MTPPDPDDQTEVDAMAEAVFNEALLAREFVPASRIVQALVLAAAMVADDAGMPPSEFGRLLMETIMRRAGGKR